MTMPTREEIQNAMYGNVYHNGVRDYPTDLLRRIADALKDSVVVPKETNDFVVDAVRELHWFAERYDDHKSTGECAADAYDMSCTARRLIAEHAKVVLIAAAQGQDHE